MKALICGVSGQDGAYLAKFLLEKGYWVVGSSRDAQSNSFINLRKLGVYDQVEKVSLAMNDFRSVLHILSSVKPDEIYNLAGQSSVGLSFEQPVETMESIGSGTLNLLEAVKFVDNSIKLYNAGSSECFGETQGVPSDEDTPFQPRSPYAVAKASAHWLVANYRESYDLFACTGILFNHESPLRPSRFVTKKIIRSACDIAEGKSAQLKLGNIEISRDWGWAPEYVEAMWLMLQESVADDYVIATGKTFSLKEFIAVAFDALNLSWQDHVVLDKHFLRPSDIMIGRANPAKARKILSWSAETEMKGVVQKMIEAEIAMRRRKGE